MRTVSIRGFTLIELAMVLFIIALILGGVLTPLSAKLEQDQRKKTQDLLDQIRDSLIGYAMVNGHLPCPDCPDGTRDSCGAVLSGLGASAINDGVEDGITTGSQPTNDRTKIPFQCATPEGNLPWSTLGLSEYDAWGNHFTYRVTDTFADDTSGTGTTACSPAPADVSFQICSTGNIDVQDGSGNAVAQNLPALVISYGKNADEPGNPSSASETANQNPASSIFIQKDYSNETGADQFDDMLMWIPASTLMYRMVEAEKLP